MDRRNEFAAMYDEGKFVEIIDKIVDMPQKELSDDICGMLSCCYGELHEYDLAIQVLEDMMSENAKLSPLWHYQLGIAYAYYGDADKAKAVFKDCIDSGIMPDDYNVSLCRDYLSMLESGNVPVAADEVYTNNEEAALEEYIENTYGKIGNVYHELSSERVHIDIAVVEPTKEQDFYTLITMGCGAHKMNVPDRFQDEKLDRMELVIYLPSDWILSNSDEKWFWPIHALKYLSRFCINQHDTWLGYGHTVSIGESVAGDDKISKQCAFLLSEPMVKHTKGRADIGNDKQINFYTVVPLYEDELNFKLKHGAYSVLKRIGNGIVNPVREDIVPHYYDEIDMTKPFADGAEHASKIEKNDFKTIDSIVGYNHIAIYLRWCIEHDMMSEDFSVMYSNVVGNVKSGHDTDLREFVRDYLGGVLTFDMFNDEGIKLAKYYYGSYCGGTSIPFYPADVDKCAEERLGEEKYNCDEYKDEAYLFVPFDEQYYADMSVFISTNYKDMKEELG